MPVEAEGDGEVLVLVAWHLGRMRDMPRAFLAVRRLDFATREARGARWVHRWISRRSVALTTRWASRDDAEAWLASADFGRADRTLGALPGAVRRLEIYRPAEDRG